MRVVKLVNKVQMRGGIIGDMAIGAGLLTFYELVHHKSHMNSLPSKYT